jgi:hypothetical protein
MIRCLTALLKKWWLIAITIDRFLVLHVLSLLFLLSTGGRAAGVGQLSIVMERMDMGGALSA